MKQTSDYFKRFSTIKIDPIPDSSLARAKSYFLPDSSISISFKLNYPDFEDPIQSLEMTQLIIAQDSGKYITVKNLNNLVLQKNIVLGPRTILTKNEKKQFKTWEQTRIDSRLLIVENVKSKERQQIKAGSHIYLFSKDTLLMTQEVYTKHGWINHQAEWILSTINSSDSTINVDYYGGGELRRRVKFTDIDSLNVKSITGTFTIIGVRDTAHNTVFK